jgi:hypothetical protein
VNSAAVAIWCAHDVSRRRSPNSIGVKSRCPASMRVKGIVVSSWAHAGMLRRSIPDTASRFSSFGQVRDSPTDLLAPSWSKNSSFTRSRGFSGYLVATWIGLQGTPRRTDYGKYVMHAITPDTKELSPPAFTAVMPQNPVSPLVHG